ncbi:MAG: twin-arginine translocation signal domain-containing protein, partial [Chloroflexi bacterium]|nr:twin-arginine translocation signal domain-containing protein [Chloroflexota bacterium]
MGSSPIPILFLMKENMTPSRRDFLRFAALGAGATVLAACSPAPAPTAAETKPAEPTSTPEPMPTPSRQLALRIAHVSDMHIEPSGPGREKFSRALRHVQTLSPAADFVINAGDCVMDALYSNRDRALEQWDAFQSVLSSSFPLPVYHAIGNHDVWGWGLRTSEQDLYKDDPLFAKGLAMQRLGISNRYYSFEQGG